MSTNAPFAVSAVIARRPRTLWEVAEWGKEFGQIDAFLREFLDEFYIGSSTVARAAMLEGEPEPSGAERTDALKSLTLSG